MATRLLVLDDEADLLYALSVRLTAAGFQCETASNGVEGLTKLRQRTPDVIVTDLIMPGETGVAHTGKGFGAFSTSTRHMRPFAAIDNFL